MEKRSVLVFENRAETFIFFLTNITGLKSRTFSFYSNTDSDSIVIRLEIV